MKIHNAVPFINITMVGETGSGKSSILNTFVTAISDTGDIIQDYRVAACGTNRDVFEHSTTKTVSLLVLRVLAKIGISVRKK